MFFLPVLGWFCPDNVMWLAIIISGFVLNRAALANMFSTPLFLHEHRSWLVFGAIVIGAVMAIVVMGHALDSRYAAKLEATKY